MRYLFLNSFTVFASRSQCVHLHIISRFLSVKFECNLCFINFIFEKKKKKIRKRKLKRKRKKKFASVAFIQKHSPLFVPDLSNWKFFLLWSLIKIYFWFWCVLINYCIVSQSVEFGYILEPTRHRHEREMNIFQIFFLHLSIYC